MKVLRKEKKMSRLATLGAAAILALAAPLPVFAQAAVSEPGMVSFYHPNADILHAGMSAYGYRGAPGNASPYGAHAYMGGPIVVQEAYPHQRSRPPTHYRSRNYPQ